MASKQSPTMQEFKAALKGLVDELFKVHANLDQIDLTRYKSFFGKNDLHKVVAKVGELVSLRSHDHYAIDLLAADGRELGPADFRKNTRDCVIFLRIIRKIVSGAEVPPFQRFAFGPRRGVVREKGSID